MGDVYRARDPRLRRNVAIKVLKPSLATPEFVARLNREARATGSLNHPNILSVFDIGGENGIHYVVSELLEGESLRVRLNRGPVPTRKALVYGIDVARALAAAHDKGICHRDVKPGNIFLTVDGRVKLIDFGLARVTAGTVSEDDSTASAPSEPGGMRGTVGYMSPEQVLGVAVDPRADIFALGTVLYEMFTGRRAFDRPSPIEIQSAVLKDEPQDPIDLNPSLPFAISNAVRRCLEKNMEERFQSARDLAYHLGQIEQAMAGPWRPKEGAERRRRTLLLGLCLVVMAAIGAYAGHLIPLRRVPLTFQQLTFHRGRIGGARFSSDGIVYSLAMGTTPPQVWRTPADSPESTALGYPAADVLAAHAGKIALSVDRRFAGGERFVGSLAEVTSGEEPRRILDEVEDADWDPGTAAFAVARSAGVGAASHLEYPIGKRVYETAGSIASPRISPDGSHVAFVEDSAGVGHQGRIVMVDRGGERKVLTRDWANARGLAWSPHGDEIWFTAAEGRANRSLRAVDLDGRERLVLSSPGSLTVWDVSRDGRVLLTRDDERRVLIGMAPGGNSERDLSWFDEAGLASISADGQLVLFGDRFGVYLRRTNGAPAVKLQSGEAYPDDLSPDGHSVIATSAAGDELLLLPTGPGDARVLPTYGIKSYSGSRWFPDGHRILFNGREADRKLRSYVMDINSGPPHALTTEGTWGLSVSGDGEYVAAIGSTGITLWPTNGGPPKAVPGAQPGDRPVAWGADARWLWIFRRDEIPTLIYRLEIATGRRQLWKRVAPTDPDGVYAINELQITPTGDAYFYSYRRVLSELYVVRGLR